MNPLTNFSSLILTSLSLRIISTNTANFVLDNQDQWPIPASTFPFFVTDCSNDEECWYTTPDTTPINECWYTTPITTPTQEPTTNTTPFFLTDVTDTEQCWYSTNTQPVSR